MDPICDITEVSAEAETEPYSTVGQFTSVAADAACFPSAVLHTETTVNGSGSVVFTESQITRTTVGAAGAVTPSDHLDAHDFETVTARGAVSLGSLLRDLTTVTGDAAVTAFQSRVAQFVTVAAAASIQAIQNTTFRSLTTVGAAGVVTITNARAVRQIVDVAAAAAAIAFQRFTARDVTTVGASALAEVINATRTTRDLMIVGAQGAVTITMQRVIARDVGEIEACADADPVDDGLPGAAWTAATESMGMSRYVLPFPLRALAPLGESVLVAGPDGLYLMDGNSDGAGAAQIDAKATAPLTDVGDSFLKHPLALYVAYASAAAVAVDVGETSNGTERTWSYESAAITNEAPRPIRILTGKGIRSRYLRFAVANTDGARLRVHDVEYDTIQTTRRT